jgi:hypothetical protein
LREWLTAYPFARRGTRRYLDNLVVQHREFSLLGRAKPLCLEDIYVSLKVAEHTPPAWVPDDPRNPLQAIGRSLEVPEALTLSRRLLILGEAGSGKTTLLKYLVLATARRDPRLAAFARALLPDWLTELLERARCALSANNLAFPNLYLGLIALLAWVPASYHSAVPIQTLMAGALFAYAGFFVLFKLGRRPLSVGAVILATGVLVYAIWGPDEVWPPAVWLTALSLAGLLFPYWTRAPLALLTALVRRRTRYPLPVYLTLNNLARDGRPLEDHAVDGGENPRVVGG